MNKKKFREKLKVLEKIPGLSEHERILFAMSLSATPDERWRRHENFLHSHGLFERSKRIAYGFK